MFDYGPQADSKIAGPQSQVTLRSKLSLDLPLHVFSFAAETVLRVFYELFGRCAKRRRRRIGIDANRVGWRQLANIGGVVWQVLQLLGVLDSEMAGDEGGVGCAQAEGDQRSSVADHGVLDGLRHLMQVLVRERQSQCVFSGLA